MIEEYVYIEPLKKPATRVCDGNCGELLNSGYMVKVYINKAQDLKEVKYYCRKCTRLYYPRYFNKDRNG